MMTLLGVLLMLIGVRLVYPKPTPRRQRIAREIKRELRRLEQRREH